MSPSEPHTGSCDDVNAGHVRGQLVDGGGTAFVSRIPIWDWSLDS